MIRSLRLIRDRKLTLATLLDELLSLRPDQIVSLGEECEDSAGLPLPPRTLADFHREVGAMSRFLVEEAGLQRGERVAVFKANDSRCFGWFLAVIRAGGIAVPLNPMLTLPELQSIASRCEISTLITDRAIFERTILSRQAVPVRHWVQAGPGEPLDGFLRLTPDRLQASALPPADISPGDTVAIFHTSGTSGFPKGAKLSSRALLAGRAGALLAAPLAKGRARALFPLPWAHIMAVSAALHGLLAGVPAYFLPRFDVQAAVRAIERHRLTVVIGVPAMFIRLLNSSPSRESLASVRLWVSASDHLPAPQVRRLLDYGGVFVNAYGMVELGGVAMFGIASRHIRAGGEFCLRVPPFRIRVADEHGRRTRSGEVGECQIRGPGVTGAYWGDAAGTPTTLAPGGWLRTGDLAVRSSLGLVRLAGRAKDVIKCGGYSIFPGEVEEVLASHASVARAAVIGVPHAEKGEEPVAIVECHAAAASTEQELLAYCRARLAPYKVPRRFQLVPPGTMPQGQTEKILKRVLREQNGAP
jgi:acyl-CoA synthetase (AMP-forming)/AMP-acid ligase II